MVSVCTTCKGLQQHFRALSGAMHDTEQESWLNTSLPSLRRSSNGGCRACAVLLQGILLHHDRFAGVREEDIRITAESFNLSGTAGKQSTQDHLSVEVRWKKQDSNGCCDGDEHEHEHEEGYPNLKLEFFTDRDGQSPFSVIGRGRHISENPLRDGGLATARGLIKECLSRHSRCRHTLSTSLPRRVLDVLQDDGSKSVRLHEAAWDADAQRYEFGEFLTLSHCWGSGKSVLKTTSETLDSHKKKIPWSDLPKTFQDAVMLTRALGFRWLWIDSLCINQSDIAEKLEASVHMDRIFANSFLTIAATSAADSKDGLFQAKTQPFKIQATDSKGSLYKIYVREQPSHYSFKAPFDEGAHMNDWELPFNSSAEAYAQTPLLKRAWAYAERLVSPRVLHFTTSEMILECREAYQCECGRIDNAIFDSRTTDSVKQEFARIIAENVERRGELPNGNRNNNRIDSVALQLASTSLNDAAKDITLRREEAIQLWSYIVTEYTSRDLTYDEDRLVAIVGVAKAFAESLKSGYIAGQWTFSTLGLLWHPSDSARSRRPKAQANNVPSWSWASVEGSPIFFDNSMAMDLACTVSFPSERARSQAWSPIAGDTLEITAAMVADVTFRIDGTHEYSLVKGGVCVEFKPDISPPRGEDSIVSGQSLICVLVSMTFRSSIIGLVLQQSKSNAQLYRRVGRFECYECQRDNEEPEDAESLFEYWFPEVEDMTQLDEGPLRSFIVV
ncbi:heterokaryon incompatibility protein-domain-containing protein [Lophiotrema nucula]|uniref:Heterokaryon incompatibility protein-domain-containing protein n=1 Tax=Lophiotrema nucula TaxID=690887 RepID=A0A6A5YY01_9PLEO|nr:heterokaryon incompatibility protein-domain-containing protein [Lophiotrema nucula]